MRLVTYNLRLGGRSRRHWSRIIEAKHRDDGDLIIGGDFNVCVSQRQPSEERITERADVAIQARLRDEYGLLNCWQVANPNISLAQTLRWSREPTFPYHCDGLFVPSSWRSALRSCAVVASEEWDRLSDHNPVVATFEAGNLATGGLAASARKVRTAAGD
jgi:endonuclease/exonuclease/phosphatase family metal-dependent hydrolase